MPCSTWCVSLMVIHCPSFHICIKSHLIPCTKDVTKTLNTKPQTQSQGVIRVNITTIFPQLTF